MCKKHATIKKNICEKMLSTSGPLFIRADANSTIGTGHVMRCLALAEEWQARGGKLIFVGRVEPEPLRQRIAALGADLVELTGCHPDPTDLDTMLRIGVEQASQHESLGWLVLDGYHFDAGYQQAIRENGWKLLLIDDLGNSPLYQCDALLNQNLYASSLTYHCQPGTSMLLGARYALLRKEFRMIYQERFFPEVASRVLVTMGGADQNNVTARILTAFAATGLAGLEIKVVAGSANPHIEMLSRLMSDLPFQCELLCDVADMASLMGWADVAVTAAGITTYELAASGTPFVTLITADNQEANAIHLEKQRVAMGLGWHNTLEDKSLAVRLRKFFEDCSRRQEQSALGRKLVDGGGACRAVTAMLARNLCMRAAGWQDKDILLLWANDPETRKNSFHTEIITIQEHEQWLTAKLASPVCRLWIATLEGGDRVGMVRFELAGNIAEISINLAPGFRKQGLAVFVIGAACARLFSEEQGVEKVVAFVKSDNHASLRAFVKAGFALDNKEELNVLGTSPRWGKFVTVKLSLLNAVRTTTP